MKHNKLEAAEGMIFTNDDTFGKVIYLGINDSDDNWREITLEEYENTMASRELDEGRI